MPLEERLSATTADIRSFDSVAVLGAGVSAFAYPMTLQLPALLWQAISEVEGAADELARRAGRSGTPKEILGTDPETVALGWELARDIPAVRTGFQRAFANLDAGRDPSPAHRHLARLIHEGRVHFVISYNWDWCLERAHQDIYGTPLPAGVLAKPHGDVLAPDLPWTLPDEDGLVPQAVLDRLAQLDDRPRTLLVLGYSGSDPFVVEKLLCPLQNRWPVYQIGPSAWGADGVPTTADHALSEVADRLLPSIRSTGWRHVIFGRSRSFEAALRGERLRPIDVDACPELPYAKTLAERLASSRFATLSGGSGTGKSVTAFHAARRLNQSGWAVVELTRPGVAGAKEIEAFAAMSDPVLAVVDDAQALDPSVVADFEAAVDDNHAVLLVSTERLEGHNDETVSDVRAKEVIYQYCAEHLDKVEPLLTALDDRVGHGMFRESPRRRLQAANASSRDPWSFMFVASGGERRIAGILDRLAEDPPAALLLGAVAVGQLTSLDAGVPRDQAALDVAQVTAEAFGPPDGALDLQRFDATVDIVQSERLMRESHGRLRTAHIRVADRALMDLARRDDDVVGPGVRLIVRSHLLNPDVHVRGKYWVLNSFTRSDSLRYRWRQEWLDAATVDALVAQCLDVGPGDDRSVEGFLLSELAFGQALDGQHWERIAAHVINWLPDVGATDVFGLRRLLMHMRGEQTDLYDAVRRSLSAHDLATMFSSRGSRPSAPGWAEMLRELAPNHDDPERTAWLADFAENVDADAMQRWLADTDPDSHNEQIAELIDVLADLAPTVGAQALRACAPHLRTSIEADVADAAHGLSRWAFGTMGLVAHLAPATGTLTLRRDRTDPADTEADGTEADGEALDDLEEDPLEDGFGDRWVPPPEFADFAALSLEVMQEVNWSAAGASLVGRARHELESLDLFLGWLAWLSTELIDDLADAIPFEWLDELVLEESAAPTVSELPELVASGGPAPVTNVDAIGGILAAMAEGDRGNDRARTYLTDRLLTLERLPFRLIVDLPDVAAAVVHAGGEVCLDKPRGGGWESNVRALHALRKVDTSVAEHVLAESEGNLREALQSPQSHDMRGLATFITIADELNEEHLNRLLTSLDVGACEPVWRQRLGDAGGNARAVVERAAKVDGPVGDAARRLLET